MLTEHVDLLPIAASTSTNAEEPRRSSIVQVRHEVAARREYQGALGIREAKRVASYG